ncbi:MAG: MATE family efflux transporter [Verrucomicrobia bacterium]|nr:MATE family efflux transporter [Verrucomicrobiota bacterium]
METRQDKAVFATGAAPFRAMWRWRREVRPTLALAFPIMAGTVGHMLIGITDTVMIGRVGVVPLAAAAFVNAIVHLPMIFMIGLLSSVAVLTSQAFGAKDAPEAGEVLRHGLLLASGAGLVAVAVAVGLRPFLGQLGQSPEVVAAAGTYLVLFGGSMLPQMVAHAAKQYAEALSRPWPPTLIVLGSVLLNIPANWVFIYGHWGAPALGLNGAGVATVLVRLAMMAAMLGYVVFAPACRRWHPVRWRAPLGWHRMGRLISLGWPAGAQHLLEVSAFVLAALMAGWIGPGAIAAHQIAINCATMSFMFALGIGLAVCIRVGHAWGAGHRARMRRIGFVGLGMSTVVMAGFALIFAGARGPLARLFVTEPAVAALAAQLLLVAAFFQVADGVQVTALAALRGLTDVRVPALVAALAYWLVAMPLAYVLAFPGQRGVVGIWIGLATGLGAAAVALAWRFHALTRE